MTNDQIILDFIKRFINGHNYGPTFDEIKTGCGLSSKSLVNYWLDMLEDNGMIHRDRNTIRGITVPFASFVRDVDSFGVVVLVHDKLTTDLIVDHWLVRNVSEAEARSVLEMSK